MFWAFDAVNVYLLSYTTSQFCVGIYPLLRLLCASLSQCAASKIIVPVDSPRSVGHKHGSIACLWAGASSISIKKYDIWFADSFILLFLGGMLLEIVLEIKLIGR